jgi:hypothetical protein
LTSRDKDRNLGLTFLRERRHSSAGPEQLICNSKRTFCAPFHEFAQPVFRRANDQSGFAPPFAELRSFAAKNWRTVEATVKELASRAKTFLREVPFRACSH